MWYCILTLQIAYIVLDSPFHKAGVLMVEDEASRIEKITCRVKTQEATGAGILSCKQIVTDDLYKRDKLHLNWRETNIPSEDKPKMLE